MKVSYLHSENIAKEYAGFVEGLIRNYCARQICDVGAGANPLLSPDFIRRNELNYTILDISREELEKVPSEYKKLVQDIEATNLVLFEQFDFVITKYLAEHLVNGQLFHKNVFAMLTPGGVAVHYFPTLYAMPFLVNKMTSEWLSSYLLDKIKPRDHYRRGKFPAHYSWCYGPTSSMFTMLREIGYEIIEYRGIFGNGYYNRIPILRSLHRVWTNYLVNHPIPYLTSYAQVILRKPTAEEAGLQKKT